MKYFKLITFIFIINFSYANSLNKVELPIFNETRKFDFSNSHNGKKVIINFWASWCTACAREIEELEALKKNFPKNIYIAVNADETDKKIRKFIKKHNFTYIILKDKDKKFSKNMKVKSLPQTIILGENNEIIYKAYIPPKNI